MQNFIKPGVICTFTAPTGGVVSGSPYLIGSLLVIATNTVAQTLPFEGDTEGIFLLNKATGTAWTEGLPLYWDNAAAKITTVGANNTLVGNAALAAASGDTTGQVRLSGLGGSGAAALGGVDDIVLQTTAPSAATAVTFVQTTGTKTGALPNGTTVGFEKDIVQSVAASSPVGTITGTFKDWAGTAKTTLALGTAVAFIARVVWDGTAWRQVSAIGGTGSSLS